MFLELPHDRHPERSASRIYRLTEGLQRVVEEPVLSEAEGTPRMLVGRCSSQLSGHQNDEKNQKVTTSERRRGICGSADLPGNPEYDAQTELSSRLLWP